MTTHTTSPRLLSSTDGLPDPGYAGVHDRFMVDGADAGGRFALVQHSFAPKALAAPLHRHHHEDEFTYVLTGRIGAVLDGVEVEAGPGDLLFKPRGQWHTFWNAGDDPATCLEVISPAGLEQLFRRLGELTEEPTPEAMAALAAEHGCDLDMEGTFPLVERLGLAF